MGLSMIVIMLVTLVPWVAINVIAGWLSRLLRRRLWLATEPAGTSPPAPAVS